MYAYDCVRDRPLNVHAAALKLIGSFVDDYHDHHSFENKLDKDQEWKFKPGECIKDAAENAGLNLIRTIDLITQLRTPIAHTLDDRSTREDLCCLYSVELLTGTPLN